MERNLQTWYLNNLKGWLFTKNVKKHPQYTIDDLGYRGENSLRQVSLMQVGQSIYIHGYILTRIEDRIENKIVIENNKTITKLDAKRVKKLAKAYNSTAQHEDDNMFNLSDEDIQEIIDSFDGEEPDDDELCMKMSEFAGFMC